MLNSQSIQCSRATFTDRDSPVYYVGTGLSEPGGVLIKLGATKKLVMKEFVMPFDGTPRDYTQDDFIFGLAEEITKFQAEKNVPKATLSSKVVTIKQINVTRAGVQQFQDKRLELNTAYLDSLEQHPKYHNTFTGQTLPSGSPGSNAQFRLKSKAGLNFCISSGIYLHFILDGLGHFDTVIGKNYTTTNPQNPNNERKTQTEKIRTVTGAELRWIYRNRRNPAVQKFVQFWYKKAQCCPPWEPGFKTLDPQVADWTNYTPTKEFA